MNEGQYIAFRNYLEEIASNQKQILAELRRQAADKARDELIVGIAAEKPHEAIARLAATKPKPALAGTLETEPPPDAHLAAVTQGMETPPEVDAIMPAPAASKPKTARKRK